MAKRPLGGTGAPPAQLLQGRGSEAPIGSMAQRRRGRLRGAGSATSGAPAGLPSWASASKSTCFSSWAGGCWLPAAWQLHAGLSRGSASLGCPGAASPWVARGSQQPEKFLPPLPSAGKVGRARQQQPSGARSARSLPAVGRPRAALRGFNRAAGGAGLGSPHRLPGA